jgi:hypothetical protein
MRIVYVVLMVIGAVGLIFGFNEWRLSRSTKAEPQTISCADLIAKGPGDNGHVIVTDFALLTDSFVVEGGSQNSPTWKRAMVPMVPKSQATAANPSKSFRVILDTHKVTTETELVALAKEDKIQGTIVNDVKSLDAETQKLLKNSYSGTDFSSCLILDHGRRPSSPLFWGGALAGGALSLVALVALFLWRRSAKTS